ncbi:MAG: AAA family ATPase [Bdellovibrionaceae bacterium]|nr:AAA family ATPase [Pseudobdellovibrionaceae bacterium]
MPINEPTLFTQNERNSGLSPLAERLRPREWGDVLGQTHVLPRLKELAGREFWPSLLLHGPPGCGKTSIVSVLENHFKGVWIRAHGSELKVSELRSLSEEGRHRKLVENKQTLVFIDEIHGLTKVQQEALLDPVEKGNIVVLGATTENPVFFLRPALRSRLRTLELRKLTADEIRPLLERAEATLRVDQPAARAFPTGLLQFVAEATTGDARRALVQFELLWEAQQSQATDLTEEEALKILSEQTRPALPEDDYHSGLSAMIKSIRGSDPDAALLWATQLMEGGVDPRLILRRLIISASEDIGNAEPRALQVAVAAAQGFEWVGLPEGRLTIAQAVIFLASCPKSDAVYVSSGNATKWVDQGYPWKVPAPLTQEGKDLYKNPHNESRGWVKQRYLPEGLTAETPVMSWTGRGQEKKLIEYLQWLRQSKIASRDPGTEPTE